MFFTPVPAFLYGPTFKVTQVKLQGTSNLACLTVEFRFSSEFFLSFLSFPSLSSSLLPYLPSFLAYFSCSRGFRFALTYVLIMYLIIFTHSIICPYCPPLRTISTVFTVLFYCAKYIYHICPPPSPFTLSLPPSTWYPPPDRTCFTFLSQFCFSYFDVSCYHLAISSSSQKHGGVNSCLHSLPPSSVVLPPTYLLVTIALLTALPWWSLLLLRL
jgi:hypothetical protein